MAEYIFDKQTNYGFPFTFAATDKFPLIANRVFDTYANALGYANDFYGTAVPGLILSVFDDNTGKNGIYRIVKVATADGANDGILESIGSTTATKYSDAVKLATANNVGQIIYVYNDETIGDKTYTAGAYIVSGANTLSKLGTTTAGGDIAEEVAVLEGKVGTLEETVAEISPVEGEYIETTVTTGGTSFSVAISSDEGNLLEKGSDDGLAAMFYWEGDDSE